MKAYCMKFRQDTENIDPKMFRTKNNRLIMQAKCSFCGIKESRFVKKQEANGLLSNSVIKIPLSKIPLLNVILSVKMNEIVNNFLLAGDKFMPGMHLKEPGFTYSACSPFTKNKERIEKFMRTGNANYIYKNELDKACFQHNMAYSKSKDLAKRAESNKVLRDKTFKIASDPKYDGCQRGLASMVYKFFDKKSRGSGIANEPIINWQMNFINRLFENSKKEKFIHLLETTFEVLI